jgi:hypothetical protein
VSRITIVFIVWTVKKMQYGCSKSICTEACRTTHHINLDFLYLETQDNGPYQAKNETGVSINNVFCTNTFQSNLKEMHSYCQQTARPGQHWTMSFSSVSTTELRVHVAQFIHSSIWSTYFSGTQNSPLFKTILDTVLGRFIPHQDGGQY